MTITGQKSNQLIRIISFILLISFIAQDIVWANPEITLRYANSDKLAPESFIKKTDSHSRVAGRYTAKYHERMRVLTGVGRHIESQRSEFSKLWHRWYRTFQMKQDASLAQRDKIRRSLEHLEKILIGLARIRPKCIPDKDTDNAARLEYIKLGIREVEIRLASMIGAEGILERYPGVSDAIKKSILPDLAAFLKGRRSLPDLGYKAAILKGITKLERGKDGIRDLHPQHAMHLDIRVKLYEVAEQLSELSDEVARLSLKQAELDLKPDVVNRRAPEGAAAEAEKMEKAAIIGLIASPLSIFISIFHQSYFSWLLAISYVVFMMTLPIYTARSMKRAHAFEKIDKQFWPVMQLQKLVNLVYNKEKYGDFGYGLITPFQKARDIKDLYAHDPDSHGKLSYYSFSMEEPGKPRQAMSRLYINKQEMAYVPRFVQWILYLHEWLHGRARVKTEQLNVPLTYGLPWIAFCLALLPFVVYLDPKYLKVDLMILSYNIMVLAGARIFAALMPGKVSIAGHYLLNTESWKPLTDFEIDNIIIEHAHKVTRDQISGDMVPVRRWAKGSPGDVAELVRCDPAKSEDILVIKAAYSPKGASESISNNPSKMPDIMVVDAAIRSSAKNNFIVIIAVSDQTPIPSINIADHRGIEDTMKEVKAVIRRQVPDARIKFEIRSTDCDLTRLMDLKRFYQGRQERIAKSLIETEAVATEVHGQVERLKKLLRWLGDNGYANLVLVGDYLSKKDYGFEAINVLMNHVKSGRDPKLTMLIGKSEYAFLLAMLGDEKWIDMWPKNNVMEGPAVIKSLKDLGHMNITSDMPDSLKYDIQQAGDFENMVKRLEREGRGGWEKWYRFHPKLLQIADFIINNMEVSAEDSHHNIYTTGPHSSVEEFEWRGLIGVEALFEMEREFKEHAKSRLRVIRIVDEICVIAGLKQKTDFSPEYYKELSELLSLSVKNQEWARIAEVLRSIATQRSSEKLSEKQFAELSAKYKNLEKWESVKLWVWSLVGLGDIDDIKCRGITKYILSTIGEEVWRNLAHDIWLLATEKRFNDIDDKITLLIDEEKRRSRVFGNEIIPEKTLEGLISTSRAAIETRNIDSLIDPILITLRETDGPMADIYCTTIFEKFSDFDSLDTGIPTPEERYAARKKQLKLVGINSTTNLSKIKKEILNTDRWPEGRPKTWIGKWPKSDQALEFFRIFDQRGNLKVLGVDSLDTDQQEEYLYMTARAADEISSGAGEGMSLESTTKQKLGIINDIIKDYEGLIRLTEETPFRRIWEDIRYLMLSPIFSGRKSTVAPKPSAPNISVSTGFESAAEDKDTVNPFIRRHIASGRVVEIDAKGNIKAVTLTGQSPRSPPDGTEENLKTYGVLENIELARDPALLRSILQKRPNFIYLSTDEKEELITLAQKISLTVHLGEVWITEEERVALHTRIGWNESLRYFGPTIHVGELLLREMTVEDIAQLLLEELQHNVKPYRKLPNGSLVNLDAEISTTNDPYEMIHHDDKFINRVYDLILSAETKKFSLGSADTTFASPWVDTVAGYRKLAAPNMSVPLFERNFGIFDRNSTSEPVKTEHLSVAALNIRNAIWKMRRQWKSLENADIAAELGETAGSVKMQFQRHPVLSAVRDNALKEYGVSVRRAVNILLEKSESVTAETIASQIVKELKKERISVSKSEVLQGVRRILNKDPEIRDFIVSATDKKHMADNLSTEKNKVGRSPVTRDFLQHSAKPASPNIIIPISDAEKKTIVADNVETQITGILDKLYFDDDMAVKGIVNPDDRPLNGIYGAAGTDISNFLLSTNAAQGAFIARYKGLKQANLETGRPLLKSYIQGLPINADYVSRKRHSGYGVNTFAGWGIRQVVEQVAFELAFLGVKDFTARTDSNGRPEIVFMWAYPGQAEMERIIKFIDEDVADPAKYADILKEPIDIYYQRAAENLPEEYSKSDNFISKIADSMRNGGYFITDDYTTAHSYFYKPASFPINLPETVVPGREERIRGIYRLRDDPVFNEISDPNSFWFHYGWSVTVRKNIPISTSEIARAKEFREFAVFCRGRIASIRQGIKDGRYKDIVSDAQEVIDVSRIYFTDPVLNEFLEDSAAQHFYALKFMAEAGEVDKDKMLGALDAAKTALHGIEKFAPEGRLSDADMLRRNAANRMMGGIWEAVPEDRDDERWIDRPKKSRATQASNIKRLEAGKIDKYFAKGRELYEADNFEEALHAFKRVLRYAPKNTSCMIYVIDALINLERYDEALRYAKICVRILEGNLKEDDNSKIAHVLSAMSRCYYGRNEFEKAIEPNRRAVSIDPGNPDNRHHLVYALFNAGCAATDAARRSELLNDAIREADLTIAEAGRIEPASEREKVITECASVKRLADSKLREQINTGTGTKTALNPSPAQPFAAADSQCREDLETRPIADNERILLSESLFTDGTDEQRQEFGKICLALAPILNKPGSHIEILSEKDIMKRVTNDGENKPSKDKVAAILSQEDKDNNHAWSDPGKAESIKATVIFAGSKLTGANYLYLTGLIGFARAVMAKDRDKVAMYYKLLTGNDLSGDVLKLLDIAGSSNTIPFALKLILKFRPIVKIDPVELENLRVAMENLLIAA